MQILRLRYAVTSLLLLAVAIYLWKEGEELPLSAISSIPEPSPIADANDRVSRHRRPVEAVSAASTETSQETKSSENQSESIAELINNTNDMNMFEIRRTVSQLRTYPPQEVTNFFLQNLKTFGSNNPRERDRLIMVANSLQSNTDLPFWLNLLQRETPRYENEAELRNPPHPTLESRLVDLEQGQAIRNIGILSQKNREARKALQDLILAPDATKHRAIHRERAYIALKESDLAGSLRVLKQLPKTDELLTRLEGEKR